MQGPLRSFRRALHPLRSACGGKLTWAREGALSFTSGTSAFASLNTSSSRPQLPPRLLGSRPNAAIANTMRQWEEALERELAQQVTALTSSHAHAHQDSPQDRPDVVLAYCVPDDKRSCRHHISRLYPGPLPTVLEVETGPSGAPVADPAVFARALRRALDTPSAFVPHPPLHRLRVTLSCEHPNLYKTATVVSGCFFNRAPYCSPLHAVVDISGHTKTPIVADGVAVSTAFGSRTFSEVFSGTPLISDAVQCVQLATLRPTSLSFRPLLLPTSTTFRVHFTSLAVNRTVLCTLDEDAIDMPIGTVATIVTCPHPYTYVTLPLSTTT